MLDASTRKSLSQDLRRLITGRMTNDAFDDGYYETYHDSDDRAVREIAGFGYSLYSSDLPWPYRLRGRHAVDNETRSAAARAVLFLRSGRDYEWPPSPTSLLSSISLRLGIPLGVVLWLLSLIFWFLPIDSWGETLATWSCLIFIASIAGSWLGRPTTEQWRCYQESGDFDVWPFLRQSDLEDALKTCHLFSSLPQ